MPNTTNPKTYKLMLHPKSFSPEECLISQKESAEVKKGSIVSLFSLDDPERCHLLLQITSFSDEIKSDISVEQTIAMAFGFKNYTMVCLRVIEDLTSVSLDSVEVTFKDQYLGRSEMWRVRNWLQNTCVYISKKLEYCDASIRCQIYEMWSKGYRVAAGIITENTKIVFRSSTSNLYLFIQMSSEMWDFDIFGDLYFEKAINGFLADLFQKWKKLSSNHDVTIVFFSRTFYEAKCIEDFPEVMKKCLQIDHKNRFYEDFYLLAIQNERFDDWNMVLTKLRKMFTSYQSRVLQKYSNLGLPNVPKAYNSTAACGNYLEVLNMSLNIFEKHFLDRNFDRTGQLSVVISPGVGVFEVDRDLTNITMQRIIDSGVGSDLVCIGEQPLHAVPLLKFHNKHLCFLNTDDYSMPHWINLSFYSTNKKVNYSTFTPRIKLPPLAVKSKFRPPMAKSDYQMDSLHNSLFDYDDYDSNVFALECTLPKESYHSTMSPMVSEQRDSSYSSPKFHYRLRERKLSSPEVHHRQEESMSPSASSAIHEDRLMGKQRVSVIGNRTLINPFDPARVTVKLTSNRRRWTHIFPKKNGILVQPHHHKSLEAKDDEYLFEDFDVKSDRSSLSGSGASTRLNSTKRQLVWGATGEQEWSPQIMTGVDWKSLTIPACLPITTDFFPEESSLQNDYVFSVYTLLPEDLQLDFAVIRSNKKSGLTASDVFRELISQRLSQGFQAILMPKKSLGSEETFRGNNPRLGSNHEEQCEQLLSIGRVFHKILLNGSSITVNQYRPRHPHPMKDVFYRYRFQTPFMTSFEDEEVRFTTEKVENYKWNYLDQYICARGHTDFRLKEDMKYWRYRMFLLPNFIEATKTISDALKQLNNCDQQKPPSDAVKPIHFDIYSREAMISSKACDELFKFLEVYLNRVKKLPRKTHKTTSVGSPLRERLGSTRLVEKSRPRSGSVKVGEKSRMIYGTLPDSHSSNLSGTLFDHGEDNEDTFSVENQKLKPTASTKEIFELFTHPQHGITYLAVAPTLPSCSFTSRDAINWINTHFMEAPLDPIKILTQLRDEKYICHASGDFRKPIISGFYLYYVYHQDSNGEDFKAPLGNLRLFENEWMEVQIVDNIDKILPPSALFGECFLDVDINNKSDRAEWGHASYHKVFVPGYAFEITVEWIAASGSIINDLVSAWNRKAINCNYQLIPVPHDPIGGEFLDKLNPFRSPIYIPLNFDGIEGAPTELTIREFIFLENIATKFGFLPTVVLNPKKLFIHVTGLIFLYLPPFNKPYTTLVNAKEYCSSEHPVGFLLNCNHLYSNRRGKSSITNDSEELFQNGIVKDFKNFCANTDNRLGKMWSEYV